MSDFFDREIDKAINREVNKAVDDAIDTQIVKYLEPHLGEKQLERMKRLVKRGQPLNENVEKMLRRFLTEEQLEEYRQIHNTAIKAQKADKDLRQLESDLKTIDKLFG